MNNFDRVECLKFLAEKMGGSYDIKIGLALEIMGEFNNLTVELVEELRSCVYYLTQCEKAVANGDTDRYPSTAINQCAKDIKDVLLNS